MAYTAAGLAKAFSSTWRSGAAVPIIIGSEAHGNAAVARLLATAPALRNAATWSAIAFEWSFVLAVVGPWQLTAIILAIGTSFHLGCAIFMGLNSFLWAFPATCSSVWFAAQQLSPWW